MTLTQKHQREWFLIPAIIIIGIVVMCIAGQFALRMMAHWNVPANMDSALDPNATFAAFQGVNIIEPVMPEIQTPLSFDYITTPVAPVSTPNPVNTSPPTLTSTHTPASSQTPTSTMVTYTISGNVGIAGAILNFTGGSTNADGSGNYAFVVSSGWSGTVTPEKAGYTFTPAHKTYTNVQSNQSSQNYAANQLTYTISGNAGVASATLNYTGGSTTADGSGNYSFTVVYNWSGTVTPARVGYTFAPASRTYNNVQSNHSNQDYTANQLSYAISGNAGVAGATLNYTGGSTTADGSGFYAFTVSSGWSGTVTPARAGYTFSPVSRTYTNIYSNQVNQDYTANQISYTISGNAGVAGATLNYTGGSTSADGSGFYSFTVSSGWSGSVTPTLTGYTFTPASRTYTNVQSNYSNQDYTATALAYTISGNAGVASATLNYTGGSTTADGSGNYSFTVAYNWSGTVTPTRAGYTFTPASRTYTNVQSNYSNQDYTATALVYTISGNVGVAGANLIYTGGITTADGSGNYSFTVAYDWSGSVTPSMTGLTFTPASRTYTNVQSNYSNQDYTAVVLYVISGNAGVAGATLNYTGGSTTADGSGFYSFTVSSGWSGSVTPTLTGYTFTPASRAYTNVLANQINQDYTATALYTISGNVGIPFATLNYTGGSTTTDGSGYYSFTVSSGWSGTVTPSLSGYTFTPVSRTYSNVQANQVNQDYTATPTNPGTCTQISSGFGSYTVPSSYCFRYNSSSGVNGAEYVITNTSANAGFGLWIKCSSYEFGWMNPGATITAYVSNTNGNWSYVYIFGAGTVNITVSDYSLVCP